MSVKVVSRMKQKLIFKLDKLLGCPDYRQDQFICPYIGLTPQFNNILKLKNEIRKKWWVKSIEDGEANKILSNILEVPVVSIWPKDKNLKKSIFILKKIRKLFFNVVKNSTQINNSNTKISMGELYDRKVVLDKEIKNPGYGSFQFGLLPDQTAKLLGMSLKKLKLIKKLVIGVGGGDFVMYSLPGSNGVLGVDVSQKMVDLTNLRGIPCVCGDISVSKTDFLPKNFLKPDLIIADYFLDIIKNPVTVLDKMSSMLEKGGKMMIINMLPIDQEGPGDLVLDKGSTIAQENFGNRLFKISIKQVIGNSHNPWVDILRLKEVCGKFGLVLDKFSITTYALFDSGRSARPLPAEFRPSVILIFEKK